MQKQKFIVTYFKQLKQQFSITIKILKVLFHNIVCHKKISKILKFNSLISAIFGDIN